MLWGDIPADAPGDPRRGVLDRIPGKVSVPGGGLHLGMAKQLADHREALAQGRRSGRIRVAWIVECVLWPTKSSDSEAAGATAKSGEKVMQASPAQQLNSQPSGMKTGHRPAACAWL